MAVAGCMGAWAGAGPRQPYGWAESQIPTLPTAIFRPGWRGNYELQTFDFMGYTFRPRRAEGRDGRMFVCFIPAMSSKAAKAVRTTIRGWNLAKGWNTYSLAEVAKFVNPFIRGWINYYGRFHRSKCLKILAHVKLMLATLAWRRYKRFKGSWRQVFKWLMRIAKRDESLFVLWAQGVRPTVGR